ncbi:MAG: translocation/assembly module TamB domain-containing protein [Hyphomonadaceae bacterium]
MRLPRFRKRTMALAAGAALVSGGAVIALGPAAPSIVDGAADGRRVWRLGALDVDGVSGSWLGGLRAERVTLTDEQGVWLEATNLTLNWRPQDLLFGRVTIDAAAAQHVAILREPILSERRPSSGASIDVRIAALNLAQIDIAQQAMGEASRFSAALELDLQEQALNTLDLTLNRLDDPEADRALVTYRSDDAYVLRVDIAGAPGGVLSRILGVPEQNVRIEAAGDGDLQTGDAAFSGAIGDQPLLSGVTQWTPTRWSTEGAARLDLLPGLQSIAARIGPRATLNASGLRAGAFSARATTPFLAVTLDGAVDENYELDGPAQVVATANRLSDIARESPFELGAARFEGELRQTNGVTGVRGALDAQDMQVLGRSVRMSGPVQATLNAERFALEADLAAPQSADPLFANARLRTDMVYERERRRYQLNRTTLEGDALALQAQGWVNGGDGEFAGEWRVRKLEALAEDLRGAAAGRWRALASTRADEARIWTVTVDGAGERISGAPEIAPQLLGSSPNLDGLFRYEDGGITVSHLRVDGPQVRAGATGRIVEGHSDLSLEASARGPLSVGGAEIGGVIDATGRLTGAIARPTLTATAQLTSFASAGVVIDNPQLIFTLAPRGNGYTGRAHAEGAINNQALSAESHVAIANGGLALTDLSARAGDLQATGSASIMPRGASAQLTLNGSIDGLAPGLAGRIDGDLALTPERLQLDAQIADARTGDLRVRAATITAQGPLSAIEARFDMRGALRRAPLSFSGQGQISIEGGATRARFTGEGALAGAAIATRTPLLVEASEGAIDAALDMRVGDGAVSGQWQDRGRALSGRATIEDAPLAPLAAIWGETATGRIDGNVSLANARGGLAGDGDLTFTDARFAGRQRGTLNLRVVGTLEPNRLRATMDATSSGGLVARFEADAPVETSAAPIRVALVRDRRGRGSWSVRGPAETLWSAARLPDQTLSGQLEGEGEIEFGAGYLAGDGEIEIADGRFEDKLTGIVLTDLDALVSIGDRGVNIERFTATSPRGGRLTASGGSANPNEGRIAIEVADMWVANRPDARARASGALTLSWQGLQSDVEGELRIAEADVSIAQNPEAGIPTLDVVEINRPGDEGWLEEMEAQQQPSDRARATRLNVRVTAPGRVFTRGRGVEAEWSLNLRLAGTAAAPRVIGEAETVRGTLALSGQPFEIERGRIVFNGDPRFARLDILARRDTPDLTANITISGTASDPEIALTSTPALPEDEILPQVLFGRSVEDLSPLEAAQIATALATLSGQSSFDLVDAARAAAGLDRFNVRQDEDGGLLVAGGVYLTRDVYVEVARTGLGQAATRVEWTLRPRLVLITSFLGNGDQRVSLRWRHETD